MSRWSPITTTRIATKARVSWLMCMEATLLGELMTTTGCDLAVTHAAAVPGVLSTAGVSLAAQQQ